MNKFAQLEYNTTPFAMPRTTAASPNQGLKTIDSGKPKHI